MKFWKRLNDLLNTPASENKNNKDIPLTTAALYDMARRRDIPVYDYPLEQVPSLSIMNDSGKCTVGLGMDLSGKEEHVCLAHEMGHCVMGAFYRVGSSGAVRGKCEYKADKWAIYHLVPPAALREALQQGVRQTWQLCEIFDVTEDFMRKALDFYACVRPEIFEEENSYV